ncbi:hypothetical protein EVAR_98157_1 [Eumeta japonica]|uniref:Uncharacterized protein n=1 Tax=Eumeta variegata TaxID=151549 RepID=A0A4C1XNM9_EUMVA|nr:hypothetical protein EVAR_98157_1 [Eumeta japonica]
MNSPAPHLAAGRLCLESLYNFSILAVTQAGRLHSTVAHDLVIVSPLSGRSSHTLMSSSLSPLENSFPITSSTSGFTRPLPLQLADFVSYVG